MFRPVASPFVTSEVTAMKTPDEKDAQQPSGLLLGSEPIDGMVYDRAAAGQLDDGKDVGGPGGKDTGDDDSGDHGDSDGSDKSEDTGDADGKD
jgi:hypothetical protein